MILIKKQIIEIIQGLFQIGELNCSDKAVHILARNYLKLKKITEEIDKYRVELWRENFGKETKINDDHPNVQKYTETYNKELEKEIFVDLEIIEMKDLNLDKNSIKPLVLANISCLISDFDKV